MSTSPKRLKDIASPPKYYIYDPQSRECFTIKDDIAGEYFITSDPPTKLQVTYNDKKNIFYSDELLSSVRESIGASTKGLFRKSPPPFTHENIEWVYTVKSIKDNTTKEIPESKLKGVYCTTLPKSEGEGNTASDIDGKIKEAVELAKQGQEDEAITYLQGLHQTNPRDSIAILNAIISIRKMLAARNMQKEKEQNLTFNSGFGSSGLSPVDKLRKGTREEQELLTKLATKVDERIKEQGKQRVMPRSENELKVAHALTTSITGTVGKYVGQQFDRQFGTRMGGTRRKRKRRASKRRASKRRKTVRRN